MKLQLFILSLFISLMGYAQQQTVIATVTPDAFEENQSITITVQGSSVNEATWAVTGNALYLWAWSFDINDTNILDCPTNGAWTSSNEVNKFIYNSGTDTYTYSFTPTTFYNRTNIGRIGFLVKAKNGTGDKKSQDFLKEVGAFQVNLTAPAPNSSTIINSGGSLSIAANNTNGNANYNLKANGISINMVANVSTYTFNHTNITSNQDYSLEVTQGTATITRKFNVIVNPGVISQTLPVGLVDGINYNTADATKATIVLNAPGKDFIYVAGSFNNWQPTTAFAMKKDTASGKFWLELTGLVSGNQYTYQYWVVDQTPSTGSPSLVKTADPFSTLVLSPFDDPFIPAASYPNLPPYPTGQEREVTLLQTGQPPYVWSNATTNFVKPNKDNLVIYEVLIRDFDASRNFQSLINRIEYFKNLKVNAIQLMPVMEYEGNESWGYNTSYHTALDKYYGTENKFKEFIDLCHQNGIAVILDVALNHAFGRNPMVRMWMKDADGDGWGDPAADNPYFNEFAKHSYGVGSDFNHTSSLTKTYVKAVIKHWVQNFKIDGFRWDLTKGFTQNCSGGDDTCTNAYQADRVQILKEYADYSWTLDNNHYAIFEHLGSDNEEQQWANYRLSEGKGIMMWGEMTYQYSQLMGGYATDVLTRMGHVSRGFQGKRLIGYPESHDKDRLMYTALTFGSGSGTAPVNGNLNNALFRMSTVGATSILIPGPKMIWHFAELGMNNSIYTCNNGTVNTETDPTTGDCKLDTKPQPQWVNNWLGIPERAKIYNDWAKMIDMKKNNPVFNGEYAISPNGNNIRQRIYVFDNSLPASQLKNVVILANYSVGSQGIVPDFPYTGTWVNLMDNTTINVTNTTTPITIEPGGFRVYGNQAALSSDNFERLNTVALSPNPANDYFTLNADVNQVDVYSITGQLVKSFKNQLENYQFSISDLNKGIYLVKVVNSDNQEKSMKLIKQ